MNYKYIESAHNQEIKHLIKLISQNRYRQKHHVATLEGIHLIETFIQAGYTIQNMYVPHSRISEPHIQTLMTKVTNDKIILIADHLLAKISDLTESHEPIALVDVINHHTVSQNQDVVLLERIQDPGNVGTILRTALASGISQIVLSKDCCDVWSPKVVRAAMGAHAFLHILTVPSLTEWITGYTCNIYATVLSSESCNLYDLDLQQPAGWLFGNEGSGLSAEILQVVTQHVRIPMAGATESLNVAMAATVCLFEQFRQRNAADKIAD